MLEANVSDNRKGQLGRIAVIGGSEDYTGAPYFSAMASAKLGCDMVRPFALAPSAQETHTIFSSPT